MEKLIKTQNTRLMHNNILTFSMYTPLFLSFSQLKNWLHPIVKTQMYLAIWKGVIIKLCEMWKKRWKLENHKKVVALVNQLSMETTTWWGVGREKENRKKPIFCCICARMSMTYRKFGSEIKLVELVEEGAWTARYRPWEKLKGNLADAGPPLNVTLTEECEPADDVVNSLLDRSMMMMKKIPRGGEEESWLTSKT